jgi:hypothetical protein
MKKRIEGPQKTSDALRAEIGGRQRAEEALGDSEQRLQDMMLPKRCGPTIDM